GGGDGIFSRFIADPNAPGPIATLATVGGSGQISPPSQDGSNLLFGSADPGGSRIVQRTLGTNKHRTLVRSRRLLLFDPAVSGKSFIYTRTDARRGRLMIRGLRQKGAGRVLVSLGQSKGMLWTSALISSSAYVTIINPHSQGNDATIFHIPLG